jgi:hypothetical protein
MNRYSRSLILICPLAFLACGAPASEENVSSVSPSYSVHYKISPEPADRSIRVEMTVKQSDTQLKELKFGYVAEHLFNVNSDGDLNINNNQVTWLPGKGGGTLSWKVHATQQRNGKGYDAYLNDDWGILRAEDIIPRARTRTVSGATSKTSISFALPPGWSAVSEYAHTDDGISIDKPERRFDQPSGWIALGKLGTRRESIAGTDVIVAAPRGQGVRRLDMLALLNWTLPELAEIVDQTLPRLTIVSAGDPMWRGGLSAPASMFIHADRPLISENATSTLVHELVHVTFDIHAADGFDWIVEGLAEYYSLELLRRGSAITAQRHRRALQQQAEWANDATTLCGGNSSGATTALAVTIFQRLDKELKRKTAGSFDLDMLVRELVAVNSDVTLASLQQIAAAHLGETAAAITTNDLPGCGG